MKEVKIKKGTILQKSGDVNRKVYHVISGLLRSYTIDEKGKEYIFMFAPAHCTIAYSQPKEKPSDLYIDVLEDALILVFPKDLQRERRHAEALIKRLSVLQKRVIMLMSASATQGDEHFEETYPGIAQSVTQKMIASYLGTTPEALSKLKRERLQ